MRVLLAAALAGSVVVSSALAADVTAPLPAGKPAGVKQADIEMGGVVMWAGIAALAAGIAVLAAGTQGGNASSGTTQ